MIVYEFWLKEQFKEEAFETLTDGFGKIGNPFLRKIDNEMGSAVYSVSRNPRTHWVQLLVDENTPQSTITAIEARINELKDDTPSRKYRDDTDNNAPIETSKHFTLERVLKVRQRQKDKMLGRIEDVQ